VRPERKLKRLRQFALAIILLLGLTGAVAAHLSGPVAPNRHVQARPEQPAAVPRQFEGRVVRIADGDSLDVMWRGRTVQIRLNGIDAPEYGQPWSRNARSALAALVASQNVRVQVVDTDRYGRAVATVSVHAAGRWIEVNRALVRQGHAWVYRRYNRDRSALAAEQEARSAGSGLWSLPASQRVPPWDYRQRHRDGKASRP
jgi:endonuclease YncB( thermonuclease family)